MLKKDEKSHKNELTVLSIFDTMNKHLSRQADALKERRHPQKTDRSASKEAERKLKKRVDKEA